MEEKTHPTINITIHGGNNQILPNATKVEQHFHFAGEETGSADQSLSEHPWTTADEARLSLYVSDREKLTAYIATLVACRTASEVGEAVVQMCADEPKLTAELIAREKFIRILLPFLTGVVKGKGIDNLRLNINDAWAAYRKNRLKKGL